MGEMKRPGRPPRLTDEQIVEIRESQEKGDYLAAMYGVSHQTISKIRRGELYARVGGTIGPLKELKFTAQKVRNIRAKREAGATLPSIAAQYGCSTGLIQAICARRTYKWVK